MDEEANERPYKVCMQFVQEQPVICQYLHLNALLKIVKHTVPGALAVVVYLLNGNGPRNVATALHLLRQVPHPDDPQAGRGDDPPRANRNRERGRPPFDRFRRQRNNKDKAITKTRASFSSSKICI